MLILQFLGWAFVVVAFCGVAYALVAARLAARFMRVRAPVQPGTLSVTLLKPLHGAEPGLAENLESFCRQDYAGPVQIVFSVQDKNDAALAIAEDIRARFAHLAISIVVDARVHGANAKISNVVNAMAAARHDVLVLSDADIRVAPDWLGQVITALTAPGVGLVTCLYTGHTQAGHAKWGPTVWSRLGAMGNSYDFLPNAILGHALGLAHPCFGSTIALRRETLKAIGGFVAFADYLADDYEIGRAVRLKGLAIAIPALGVLHMANERSFMDLFRHELRWARTVALLNRGGHLGSIVALPLPLALLGALFLAFAGHLPLLGALALGAALASRLFLKWRIDAIFETDAGSAWLLPLRDLLSLAVYMAALFGATVHWRGTRFAVQRDGAMSRS